MKNVLTIAGSDSSGGAGIQADLKTFCALGTYGMSVITAVTAQNTLGVTGVEEISPRMVAAQIDAVFQDIRVDAVKIGMVSSVDIIKTIASKLREYKAKNIVVDPVMVSKSGHHLLRPEARDALIRELIPLACVVTPNLMEAEVLTSIEISSIGHMEQAARAIHSMGPANVLVKGGHLEGDEAVDILFDGKNFAYCKSKRIHTKNTHGTGCTLSSATAAYLAKGYQVKEAVKKAKDYITVAIKHSIELGKGAGPTHHFYELYKKAGMVE